MNVFQKEILLPAFERGMHLITSYLESGIKGHSVTTGVAHIFIKHTSAGLTINENADPSVRKDFENFMDDIVPENVSYFTHTMEGPDDMPAHIKSSLMGTSVSVPISNGSFNLGTWQGVYLCEFRNTGGQRKIVVTISGD